MNEYEKIGQNLWKKDGKYYRLTANGVTPNGCWLINATMKELVDIDIATGNDIYGESVVIPGGITGTVSASHEYIKAKHENKPEFEIIPHPTSAYHCIVKMYKNDRVYATSYAKPISIEKVEADYKEYPKMFKPFDESTLSYI